MSVVSHYLLVIGMLTLATWGPLFADCPDRASRRANWLYGIGSGATREEAREHALDELILQLQSTIESSSSTILSERLVLSTGSIQSSFKGPLEGLMVSGSCEKTGRYYVEVALDRQRYGDHLHKSIATRFAKLLSNLKKALAVQDIQSALSSLKQIRLDQELQEELVQCHGFDRCAGLSWSRIDDLEMIAKTQLSGFFVEYAISNDFREILPTINNFISSFGIGEKIGSGNVMKVECEQMISESGKELAEFVVAKIDCLVHLKLAKGISILVARFQGRGIGGSLNEAVTAAKRQVTLSEE